MFASLHGPYYFTLPSLVGFWSNIWKQLLFSGSSSAETPLSQKQLIPAPFYLKSISLLLISETLLYLSMIPSYMSAVGEETNEPETSLRWKLFFWSSLSHLTPEIFVFPSTLCLSFVFFVFVFWPIETTTTNLQCLTHSNHSKSTNQVTLSNEHMNFWA